MQSSVIRSWTMASWDVILMNGGSEEGWPTLSCRGLGCTYSAWVYRPTCVHIPVGFCGFSYDGVVALITAAEWPSLGVANVSQIPIHVYCSAMAELSSSVIYPFL